MKLDPWQQALLEYDGNIVAACGRQVGKSTVVARKAAEYALANPYKLIMVISAVERQAELLFQKILSYLIDEHKGQIKMGKDRPTKHKLTLKNGAEVYCLPCGIAGIGIRGYTIDLLIVDEAAYVPDEVFIAITPSLVTTKAKIILLSTPAGKQGYFWESYEDPNFKAFHVSSLDCPRANKDYLEKERKRMTRLQFAQEYEGRFIDELRQFFSNELIEKCMTIEEKSALPIGDRFMGVDVARMGGDQTVIVSVSRDGDKLRMFTRPSAFFQLQFDWFIFLNHLADEFEHYLHPSWHLPRKQHLGY